jgi:CheY-like chemotaxis protein
VTAKNISILSVFDTPSVTVLGDPARLQQVIWNLLSNSAKFTPRGGRIEVRMERVDSHVDVVVTDSGEGIAPELLPHVFERFWQADGGSSRKHGGLGLGLSIVRQLTELHGGRVRVESAGSGLGTTFVVSLPVAVFHTVPAETRMPPAAADPLLLEGVRVLAVDDDADARELIRRTLERVRAETTVAGSVDEALAVFEKTQPHVLVSDIGMPGRDGYVLIHEIRSGGALARDLPAIALTAYARPVDRRKILLSGFQLHLAKPIEPNELIAAIASLVGRTGAS